MWLQSRMVFLDSFCETNSFDFTIFTHNAREFANKLLSYFFFRSKNIPKVSKILHDATSSEHPKKIQQNVRFFYSESKGQKINLILNNPVRTKHADVLLLVKRLCELNWTWNRESFRGKKTIYGNTERHK